MAHTACPCLAGQLEAGPEDWCDLPVPSHCWLLLRGFSPDMPSQCRAASGWPKCCHRWLFPAQCPAWPGLPALPCWEGCWGLPAGGCLLGVACWGLTAAAAAWAACSSFPLQRSLLYCNHTISMPLKCHIRGNPHKQGISSCQKIVVLLLMTHFPPTAPLLFFLNIIFSLLCFFGIFFCFILFCS